MLFFPYEAPSVFEPIRQIMKKNCRQRIAIEFVHHEEETIIVGDPVPAGAELTCRFQTPDSALAEIDFGAAPEEPARSIFPTQSFNHPPTTEPDGDDLKGPQGQTTRF